ncbi:MAG: hypothetical protein EXX96DRAFT_491977 [Benjaminiella poitrasii]|nr:MAG: hypothetical protein EXX96DRAFT_491977 [Benjaminiella poitrasii]
MDTKLAFEILANIINYLRDDQQMLLQLNRASKRLYNISTPLLFCSPKFESFRQFESFANTLTSQNGMHVKYLDLHMVPHRWDSTKIDQLLLMITENTPSLELINLDHCSQLTNKALVKITKPLKQLRILSVDDCRLVSNESIKALVTNCAQLQKLYLGSTRIDDGSLSAIATHLPHLTHLYIPDCQLVSEVGIQEIIQNCKLLQHVNVVGCFNIVGIANVNQSLRNRSTEVRSDNDGFMDPNLEENVMNESDDRHRSGLTPDDLEDEWTDVEEEDNN